jgi:hypothetical protein
MHFFRSIRLLSFLLLPACSSGPKRVDPDRYRALILTIDSVMVRDAAYRSDPKWAGTALRALGHSLLSEQSADSSRRVEFNTLLRGLASKTDGIGSEVRLTEPEMEGAWLEVRGTIFKDVRWFHRASPASARKNEFESAAEAAEMEYPRVDSGLVRLAEVVFSLIMVTGRAGDELMREQPGTIGYQRAVVALEGEVGRLERLLASAPNTYADSNFTSAQNEAGIALSYLREYIAAGADTVPGTPGREALEKIASHAVDARWAMDRIEPW